LKVNIKNYINNLNSYFYIAVFFLFPFLHYAQKTHQLSGKTQDSLQNSIPNTNIIATPLAENVGITFAISSLEGEYKLKLQNNIKYQIAITHLGYKKVNNSCNKPQKPLYLK
jgi:hypothetical protein